MVSLVHRYLIDPAGRLLRRRPPATSVPVQGGVVDCPRNGALEGLERCMVCERLVMFEADANGDGTVECRPGVPTENTAGTVQ